MFIKYHDMYDRYIEPLRRQLLQKLGFTAEVGPKQYVATYHSNPKEFEKVLKILDFKRNPIAWLKSHVKFGLSRGSWVKRQRLFGHWQLHVTLIENDDKTRIYAHYEKNWVRHPIQHLFERGFSANEGVRRMRNLLEAHVDDDKTSIEKWR